LSCGKFPTFFSEIIRKILHYRLSLNDLRVREYLDEKHTFLSAVDWVSGSCLMVRRKALLQTALLDEHFFMYFEDIDLCKRIQEKGWEVHFFSRASLVHYGGASVRKNLLNALIEYRRSQIYFTKKYYGVLGEAAIKLFLLAKYGLNLLKWGVVYLVHKLFRRRTTQSYTFALLGKKVVALLLRPVPFQRPEPINIDQTPYGQIFSSHG
jgi:GT2 family glycosyltransferase